MSPRSFLHFPSPLARTDRSPLLLRTIVWLRPVVMHYIGYREREANKHSRGLLISLTDICNAKKRLWTQTVSTRFLCCMLSQVAIVVRPWGKPRRWSRICCRRCSLLSRQELVQHIRLPLPCLQVYFERE